MRMRMRMRMRMPEPPLFLRSSIDWTTVFCIATPLPEYWPGDQVGNMQNALWGTMFWSTH